MAGNITDYLENKLIDHSLSTASLTMPTDAYLGLFVGSPGDDYAGSNNEVSGNGYARKSATFAAAAGGSTTLSADVTFDQATGDWGNISHVAIFDSSEGSATNNFLWHGSLTANKSIGSDDQAKFSSDDFTVTLD